MLLLKFLIKITFHTFPNLSIFFLFPIFCLGCLEIGSVAESAAAASLEILLSLVRTQSPTIHRLLHRGGYSSGVVYVLHFSLKG